MGRESRTPKITDVAELAGVSIGTASKALNGRAGPSPETRQRVRAAAEQLRFRPNAQARGLPNGRSFTVGLITTDSFGRFTIPIMFGAEDALGAGELAVLLCDTRDEPERESRYVGSLHARAVDGIIVTGRRTEARQPLAGTPACPVVYAFQPSKDPRDCSRAPRANTMPSSSPSRSSEAGLRGGDAKRCISFSLTARTSTESSALLIRSHGASSRSCVPSGDQSRTRSR